MLTIERKDYGHKGAFFAIMDERKAGEMTYSMADNKMIIDHTEVEPAYNGKGIGKDLVFAAVEFARKENYKIIPLCPFANATFKKNPEIQDVLS